MFQYPKGYNMKNIVVLGSNFAGATASMEIKRKLKGDVNVTVVSPSKKFLYVPSLIWVPFGLRTLEEITFDIEPILKKKKIQFLQDGSKKIYGDKNKVELESGKILNYDVEGVIRVQGFMINKYRYKINRNRQSENG